MPGNPLSDPATLGTLIAALALIARALAWYAKNHTSFDLPGDGDDQLVRLERKLDLLLARTSPAPAFSKSTRDRAIVALGREGIDRDHIKEMLRCSERVVGSVLRKAGVT